MRFRTEDPARETLHSRIDPTLGVDMISCGSQYEEQLIMATKEIESADWEKFFKLFSQMERDTLVDIEQIDKSGRLGTVASKVPLRSVEFDQHDPCSNVLRIATGAGEAAHEIIEPIHVKLREDINNRKILQIDAEAGSTKINFHSGRVEELLRSLSIGKSNSERPEMTA
ncbi:MAG: hypothetical protein JWM99_2351 [Verrucomicrobiales bacterium]|nr:hypothetical protein [Verrucomicrobiales bacterium]